jgi:hypothetical protein
MLFDGSYIPDDFFEDKKPNAHVIKVYVLYFLSFVQNKNTTLSGKLLSYDKQNFDYKNAYHHRHAFVRKQHIF